MEETHFFVVRSAGNDCHFIRYTVFEYDNNSSRSNILFRIQYTNMKMVLLYL